jgi:hypothetical protein
MSVENHGGMKWTEETPHLTIRAFWQSYQQSSGSKQEEWVKGMMIVALILFILASDILHAIKSYDMGPPALLTL